jgi:hypothetical protein
MKEFKNLKRIATEELEKLDAQYANKSEFTAADAEMYKCLMMALEKQLRIEQIEGEMHDEEEFSQDAYGMSGRRGRSPSTGRYVSRDGSASYADGYSAGYSEAMRMSGYPPRMQY